MSMTSTIGRRDGMDFGEALDMLRGGRRVERLGWNGKGMFLVLVPGSQIEVTADRPLGKAAPEMVGRTIGYHPHIDMVTAQGTMVPWLASQTDILAGDWRVVP